MIKTNTIYNTPEGGLNEKGVEVAAAATELIQLIRPDLDEDTTMQLAIEMVWGSGNLLAALEKGNIEA